MLKKGWEWIRNNIIAFIISSIPGMIVGFIFGIFIFMLTCHRWVERTTTTHGIAVIFALSLIFITAWLIRNRPSVTIAVIVSILLILLGYIFYNPVTNNIPIKFLSICNYCKVQFYENFQNEMNGVCLLCDTQKMHDSKIFSIFPNDWQIQKSEKQKKIINNLLNDDKKKHFLLQLVCTKDLESFIKKLNTIKYSLLCELKCNECDRDVISQILILDQLVLIASEKTISSCTSEHPCGADSQCAPYNHKENDSKPQP